MKKIIKMGILVCSLLILNGCNDKQSLFEGSIGSETEEIVEIDTKKLEAFEGSEVGDNVAMVGIVNNLPGNIFYKSIELHTDREPVGITVFYDKNGIPEEKVNEFLKQYRMIAYKNARETFRLVPNLVYINYDFTGLEGDIIRFKRGDVISENCDGLKVLESIPYEGAGNFKLGMNKAEVEAVVNEYRGNGFPEFESPTDFEKVPGKKAQDYGMFVVFYDKEGKAEAFEFDENLGIVVATELLKGSYEERKEFLKNIDSDLEVNTDDFISKRFGVGVNKEDMTTIVFSKGYYK